MDSSGSDSFEYSVYGGGKAVPGLLFDPEAGAPGLGQRVELGAAIVLRLAPLGFDPRLMLEAM